ncbi:hypothetical protein [Draconibacterium sediminis]|uniref:DUF5017 domain-containing protein n=1 Tax=Draconibacterium sediminis TaxID=1544798 RepID=A0A0D8J942_9BACT|nr:hypothetical protein [Draconibacterium sediminis]KJF43520.1 hypothetical protein LH29_15035 [Draconibacterium sediminis]
MKKFKNIALVVSLLSVTLVSCLKEEIASPVVESVKFYTIDENNKYNEVTNPQSGVTYTIGVDSNADLVVIWPGGERVTMKKSGTDIDSTDINGNVVLAKSNYYSDYGLLRAKGLKTNLNDQIGWAALYKYPEAGTFDLTVIATNHGYDSYDYDQQVFPFQVNIE